MVCFKRLNDVLELALHSFFCVSSITLKPETRSRNLSHSAHSVDSVGDTLMHVAIHIFMNKFHSLGLKGSDGLFIADGSAMLKCDINNSSNFLEFFSKSETSSSII